MANPKASQDPNLFTICVPAKVTKLSSNSVTLSVGFELKLWSTWLLDFTEILTRSDTYMCLFLQLGKIFRSPGIFLEQNEKMKQFF